MNKEQHKYKNQWKHNDTALGEISTRVRFCQHHRAPLNFSRNLNFEANNTLLKEAKK